MKKWLLMLLCAFGIANAAQISTDEFYQQFREQIATQEDSNEHYDLGHGLKIRVVYTDVSFQVRSVSFDEQLIVASNRGGGDVDRIFDQLKKITEEEGIDSVYWSRGGWIKGFSVYHLLGLTQ